MPRGTFFAAAIFASLFGLQVAGQTDHSAHHPPAPSVSAPPAQAGGQGAPLSTQSEEQITQEVSRGLPALIESVDEITRGFAARNWTVVYEAARRAAQALAAVERPLSAIATRPAQPPEPGSAKGGNMGEMMAMMMGRPPKQLYPSLMNVPSLTPEIQRELEDQARARVFRSEWQ